MPTPVTAKPRVGTFWRHRAQSTRIIRVDCHSLHPKTGEVVVHYSILTEHGMDVANLRERSLKLFHQMHVPAGSIAAGTLYRCLLTKKIFRVRRTVLRGGQQWIYISNEVGRNIKDPVDLVNFYGSNIPARNMVTKPKAAKTSWQRLDRLELED